MVSFLVGNQVCRWKICFLLVFSQVQLNSRWCGFYDTTRKQTVLCLFLKWENSPSFIPLLLLCSCF